MGVRVSNVPVTHSLVNIFVSVPKQHDYLKTLDLWEYLSGFSPVFNTANVVSVRECLGIAPSLDGSGVSERADAEANYSAAATS